MDEKAIKKLIHEELAKCGIVIPVEETFDYTNVTDPNKSKEFVRLVNGHWRNGIYVKKTCSHDELPQNYYDLVFAVNESGIPVCIPVPVAERLWQEEIMPQMCRGIITDWVYENIYKIYYEKRELPY